MVEPRSSDPNELERTQPDGGPSDHPSTSADGPNPAEPYVELRAELLNDTGVTFGHEDAEAGYIAIYNGTLGHYLRRVRDKQHIDMWQDARFRHFIVAQVHVIAYLVRVRYGSTPSGEQIKEIALEVIQGADHEYAASWPKTRGMVIFDCPMLKNYMAARRGPVGGGESQADEPHDRQPASTRSR